VSISGAARDYLAHLGVERGASPNTLAAYRRDLTRYREFLEARGRAGLGEVGEGDVREFLRAIQSGDDGARPLAPSSASRVLASVRGLHRFSLLEGLVGEDVAAGVSPPSTAKDLPQVLKTLKQQGYDGVELAGTYGHSGQKLKDMLAQAGLSAPSCHVPLQQMQQDPQGVITLYREIGCRYMAIPYVEEHHRPGQPGFADCTTASAISSRAVPRST